eukprot:Rhum_TRINITY_DN14592_c4_g2::Rhum_TRINITY_DN14592_c4_g2_i1::g.100490::m.100490
MHRRWDEAHDGGGGGSYYDRYDMDSASRYDASRRRDTAERSRSRSRDRDSDRDRHSGGGGGGGRWRPPSSASDLDKIEQNLTETRGLLGHLKALNGIKEAPETNTVVFRDRNSSRRGGGNASQGGYAAGSHNGGAAAHQTLERLMAQFLDAHDTSRDDVSRAHERWLSFLSSHTHLTGGNGGASSAATAGASSREHKNELRRILNGFNELRLAHNGLARVVAAAEAGSSNNGGAVDTPAVVPVSELDRGLSVAALAADEAAAVRALAARTDETLRALRRTDATLRADLDRTEERRNEDRDALEMMQRQADELAAAVDGLRAVVLAGDRDGARASVLDVDAGLIEAGLPGEVQRVNLIVRCLADAAASGGGVGGIGGSNADDSFGLGGGGGALEDENLLLKSELRRLEERADEDRRAAEAAEAGARERRAAAAASERELEEARVEAEEARAEAAELRAQAAALRKKAGELEETVRSAETRNGEEQDHYERLLGEMSGLRTRNKQLHTEINELREGANAASTEALYDDLDRLTEELAAAREAGRSADALRAENEELRAQQAELQAAADRGTDAAEGLYDEVASLRRELDEARAGAGAAAEASSSPQSSAAAAPAGGGGGAAGEGVDDLYDEIFSLKQELQRSREDAAAAAASAAAALGARDEQIEREGGGGGSDGDKDLLIDDLKGEVQYLKDELAAEQLRAAAAAAAASSAVPTAHQHQQ